ncbi:hypothetical protein QWY95_22885, partial [Halomonas neptunia]|nr:hypothetical protein [Halomonas neptunia]
FATPVAGLRAYLAVAGGFAAEPVLGSVATVVREGLGGLDGRGGKLAASLVRADLVDRMIWFRSPSVIGGDGLPALAAFGVDTVAEAPRWRRVRAGVHDHTGALPRRQHHRVALAHVFPVKFNVSKPDLPLSRSSISLAWSSSATAWGNSWWPRALRLRRLPARSNNWQLD